MRILVVDDSALYRKLLAEAASCLPEAEAVAVSGGELALKRLESESFDLVLLDVFMEGMNGPQVLEKIKATHPRLPVVMVSGATGRDTEITLGCLANGAIDFIPKPAGSSFEAGMETLKEDIRKAASLARLRSTAAVVSKPATAPVPPAAQSLLKRLQPPPFPELLLIGVSTGGPLALSKIFPLLSPKIPVPILIVQHMPPGFTKSLAEQLDKSSPLTIKEACEGDIATPGEVLFAAGGYHMEVHRNADGKFQVHLTSTPPVHSCRPSVDVLFDSAAKCNLRGAVSVILTGMGTDGADGVANLKAACPVWCIAQDAPTSTVYGMPQAVAQRDLHDEILPLPEIAPRLNKIFRL
ncbi:MAG: chemotaxis-specific protein-glutamate methyltransferase CheB [Spartobacteria bacterium]